MNRTEQLTANFVDMLADQSLEAHAHDYAGQTHGQCITRAHWLTDLYTATAEELKKKGGRQRLLCRHATHMQGRQHLLGVQSEVIFNLGKALESKNVPQMESLIVRLRQIEYTMQCYNDRIRMFEGVL